MISTAAHLQRRTRHLLQIGSSHARLVPRLLLFKESFSAACYKNFVPKLQLERHDNPVIVELRCDEKEKQFQKLAAPGKTIGVESAEVPGVIEATGDMIDLLPQVVYPMSGHYQLRVPNNHSDTLSFLHPTVDVTVRVECPEDFRVVIEDELALATPKMWQFGARAFLTSEHVRVRWFKLDRPAYTDYGEQREQAQK